MSLTVIGAGYPRTGTASLKAALEELGVGRCYHMSELFDKPAHWAFWADAADGKPVDWDFVFEGYGAATDAPACLFYKKIADHFPEAKVILSERDPDRWFDSTQATILSSFIEEKFAALPPPLKTMLHKIGWHPAAPETHDREHMTARMTAHNEEVKRVIAPDRLLVFDLAEGWEPLCAFLGLPVPTTPFPHINSRQEFKKMLSSTESMLDTDPRKALEEQAERSRNRS